MKNSQFYAKRIGDSRMYYRIYDKQEKLHIYNAGVWGNCWMAFDMDLPEGYLDTFTEKLMPGGGDDSICCEITDRFVVEQCLGEKAGETFLFEDDRIRVWYDGGYEDYAIAWRGGDGYPAFDCVPYPDDIECNAISHFLNTADKIEVIGTIYDDITAPENEQ